MQFRKRNPKDFYLSDSHLENIFVNEFLPAAPGDYVKVYVYGHMYAELGLEISGQMMSEQLGIPMAKLEEAWNYWEELGTVKRSYQTDRDGKPVPQVEFLSLKEMMYATPEQEEEAEEEENILGDTAVQELFEQVEQTLGRTLSSKELGDILSWIQEDHIPAEVIREAVRYSKERGKKNIRYISSVVHGWAAEGLNTREKVAQHLQEADQRHYQQRRIMKALGFTRNVTEEEARMIDSWFDEMGFSMDKVLEACRKTAGIANPNFRYVDRVLHNWKQEAEKRGSADVNQSAGVSQATLNRYYEYLRKKAAEEAEARTEEIYQKIPRIREIDDTVQKLGAELSKIILTGHDTGENQDVRRKMDRLAEERAVLLTENNYEMDYTDVKYRCDKCGDTGITDIGERCTCVPERLAEAAVWARTAK